jgi:hypothetical protein
VRRLIFTAIIALAGHRGYRLLTSDAVTTLETARFERPKCIDFRVVRGTVPHVLESYVLETEGGTRLTWSGELGTDFWALGGWCGGRMARAWDRAVRSLLEAVVAEAERRASAAERSA